MGSCAARSRPRAAVGNVAAMSRRRPRRVAGQMPPWIAWPRSQRAWGHPLLPSPPGPSRCIRARTSIFLPSWPVNAKSRDTNRNVAIERRMRRRVRPPRQAHSPTRRLPNRQRTTSLSPPLLSLRRRLDVPPRPGHEAHAGNRRRPWPGRCRSSQPASWPGACWFVRGSPRTSRRNQPHPRKLPYRRHNGSCRPMPRDPPCHQGCRAP